MNRLIAYGIVGLVALLVPLGGSAQIGEQETQVDAPPVAVPMMVLEPTSVNEPLPLFIEVEEWPTPVPTLTWPEVYAAQGVEITATKTVRRCLKYRPLIDRWNPDFGLDPALIFAVMAQESACYENASDESGSADSVGLMQVIPAGWTTTHDRLSDPAINIYWGMRILWLTLNDDVNNPEHDLRRALAAYNCGWESLDAGKCYEFGGYTYADRVIDFWLPYVQEAMK